MDITKMTAIEIGEAIKNKIITSVEAVEAFYKEIENKENKIHAFITTTKEEAIAEAKAVQEKINSGELTSPLAGVPIAIKDNICTKDIKTTCASKILYNFVPTYNATVINKIKQAGMVIIGKLNMDEFAMGSTTETSYFGSTKNPHNLNKVPGGSSGGAAASVAAKETPCSLGSDTGGSIRQPASYCGVTGFKPTYGTVSRFGLIAYASSLDQIGPLANDVVDCAAIMDIIKGKDQYDGTSLELEETSYFENLNNDISSYKIAVPEECFDDAVDEDVKKAVLSMVNELEAQGATVEKVSLPFIKYVVPAYYIMATAEASSNLSRFDGVKYGFRAEDANDLTSLYENTRSEGFGDEVIKRILLGTFVLSSGYYDAYYRKALRVKAVIKDGFDRIFDNYDAIICPVAPTTAPNMGESLSDPLKMYLADIFTASANIAGLPGLSIPCGFDKNSMPIGAQILGQRLDEQKVLNLGYAFQSITDYHKNNLEVK